MKSANQIALVNGSLAVKKGAGKIKNVTRVRHFFENISRRVASEQVLSQTQSPYPVGSQFGAGTFIFSCNALSNNAKEWIQGHDQYRVNSVEVFATLSFREKIGSERRVAPVEVFFYEDTDADSTTQTSWLRTSDRDNLGRIVLTPMTPTLKVIEFRPTASFNVSSVVSQNPANLVPSKNQYLDALNLSQQLSGLRLFTACSYNDVSGQSYNYDVDFSVRYTVEARQPI